MHTKYINWLTIYGYLRIAVTDLNRVHICNSEDTTQEFVIGKTNIYLNIHCSKTAGYQWAIAENRSEKRHGQGLLPTTIAEKLKQTISLLFKDLVANSDFKEALYEVGEDRARCQKEAAANKVETLKQQLQDAELESSLYKDRFDRFDIYFDRMQE